MYCYCTSLVPVITQLSAHHHTVITLLTGQGQIIIPEPVISKSSGMYIIPDTTLSFDEKSLARQCLDNNSW
jgi:hypothetical protein